MDVQTLNSLWEATKNHGADGAILVTNGAAQLAPDEQRRFMRGKRGELLRRIWEGDSRSGAYEKQRAALLGNVLLEMGLVVDKHGWRDATTGRRVGTRLRELARLGYDWPANKEWLADNWPGAVAMTLDDLKLLVKAHNPKARSKPMDDAT